VTQSAGDPLPIVLRHLERRDRRDLDRAAAVCAPDARFHGPCHDAVGPAAWKDTMAGLFQAFPDGQFVVEDVLADADRVADRHTYSGTHTGAFLGVSPTGRHVVVAAVDLYRVAGEHIIESWWVGDVFGLLRQLGVTSLTANV
jgi:predicted ester cyclase